MSSNYFNNHLNFSKYVSLPYKRKSLIYTSINEIFWFDHGGNFVRNAPTIEYNNDVFIRWNSAIGAGRTYTGRFDGIDTFTEENESTDYHNPYYLVEHNGYLIGGRMDYADVNAKAIDPTENPITTLYNAGTDMGWQVDATSFGGNYYTCGIYSNNPVIRVSPTGLAPTYTTYWYGPDHINPGDPEYSSWIVCIDNDGSNLYWMNNYGQIWSDTNGGVSPIYDKIDIIDMNEWSRTFIFENDRMYASGDYDIVYSDHYSTPTPTFNNINNYPIDMLYLVRMFKLNNRYFLCGIDTSNDAKVWYTDNMLTGTWYDFYTRPASDYIERMIYSPTYDMYFISAHLGIAGVRAS